MLGRGAAEGGGMEEWTPTPAPRAPGARARLGPWQATWLVLGFGLVQVIAGFALLFARGVAVRLVARMRHVDIVVPPPSAQFLAFVAIAAYGLAGLWCYRFVLRRAGALLHDGGPSGVGLCPAPRRGYVAAVVLGACVAAVAVTLLHAVPPDRAQASQRVFVRALEGSGESRAAMLLLILALLLLAGPLVEEFVFRGAALAGFTARFGRAGAGTISTALFVIAHAQEKLQYPPGFIDVALMAVAALWLRWHYRSLRPAVLCHALYNFGVIAGAATLLR